ncbi:hypothetical protein YERSI8AC_180019 [Enterobacterales bacterium 8AC]|nr:hypothetical protein YERSI8AC_180019 [Enterobacterales bacterium 8AC]
MHSPDLTLSLNHSAAKVKDKFDIKILRFYATCFILYYDNSPKVPACR